MQALGPLGESWDHSAVLLSALPLTLFNLPYCSVQRNVFDVGAGPGGLPQQRSDGLACPMISARFDLQRQKAPFDALSAKCSVQP